MKLFVFILGILMFGFLVSGGVVIDEEIFGIFDNGSASIDVIILLNESSSGISARSSGIRNTLVEKKVNEEELRHILSRNDVIAVEPLRYFKTYLDDSTELLNVIPAWNLQTSGINLTGISQTVCIIDTGINYSHPDILGKNLTSCNIDCISGACVENCSEEDLNGHGTHVAGIVGASGGINGISTGVGLIGLKVFPGALRTGATTSAISNAIDWCVDNSETYNISVISMSLGTDTLYSEDCDSSFPSSFTPSVNAAFLKNISVVAASGNDGDTTGIGSPACLSKVVGVGGANKVGGMYSNGNRNSLIKLLGIGYDVNSTRNTGGYISYSGTSMATPMISGTIAIINQLLDSTSRTLSPLEIEDVLNDTGFRIYDSGSSLYYSRIDVYSALLSLDIDAPNVTLVSPDDNNVNLSVNQTFICNATDWQLSNITLKVWNSSELYYNTTNNLTGTSNETSFNLTDMPEDTYEWNCLVFDDENNSAYASTNYSLTIGGVEVNMDSPVNNSYTNINDTNFTCTSTSDSNYELSNVTFYLWNSTGDLINSSVKNISGISNESIFNYTFEYEDGYLWKCLSVSNNSDESSNSNFSITYDVTNPSLVFIGDLPTDETLSSVTKTFQYNVSDTNIANCSLIVGGEISLTNSSINTSVLQSFSKTFTPGTYVWSINCSDYAGNINSTSEDSFVITGVSNPPGGGSSTNTGGSSGTTTSTESTTYEASVSDILKGYSKDLKKGDMVNFSIFDFGNGNHLLTVEEVETGSVNLTIESEPINFILEVGQSVKLNLTSFNYYDLLVRLNSIVNESANLTIQSISELIEPIVVEKFADGDIVESEVFVLKDYFWVVVGFVLVLIGIIFGIIRLIYSKYGKASSDEDSEKSKSLKDKAKKLKGSKTKKKNGRKNKKTKT